MNILYYIHSLEIGGAEKVVVDNIKTLIQRGNDVKLVVNYQTNSFLEKDLKSQGVEIFPLFKKKATTKLEAIILKLYRSLFSTKKTWKLILDKTKPDIIHINTFMDKFYPHNIPANKVVYTFHSEVERSLKLGTKKNLKALTDFSKNGGCFFALTNKIAEQIKQRFETNNIFVIPNGVDIATIKENKLNRTAFLDNLNIPTDAFVVGHVGRFNPVKNHKFLISIFSEIEKANKNSYLLLIGDGTPTEKALIKEQIKNLKLDDKVKFLGIRKDATAIMSVLDALILPSLSESFSLVLVEAQIHGIRCIASTGVPEDVICNKNCFRIELTSSAYDWALKTLSYDLREQSTDINKFDIHTIAQQLEAAYQRILNGESS